MINFSFQTTTGIYVGSRDVYIAQLKGTLLGLRLVKFGKTEISAPAQVAGPNKQKTQAIVQAIKRVVQENNINTKKVVTALPGKDVLIRHFQMPRIPKTEWETAIKFEARKYIPFKIEELMWDFHVVLPKIKGAKMDATFVAVKKEVAQRHLAVLNEAGLKPLAIEPAPFSLMRLLVLSNQLAKGKPTAIVDVDYGLADINIVKDKTCYLTRDISLPSEKEVVFESLLNEIRMSLDYYEKLFPAEVIGKILLCGEVELEDWDRTLAQELKVPVEKANVGRAIKMRKASPALSMSVAIGLALRGVVKGITEVNVYQVREIKPKALISRGGIEFTPEVRQALFRAVVLSCVGLLILYLAMYRQVAREEKAKELVISARPKVSLPVGSFSYSELEETKKGLGNRLSVLKLIIDERIYWTVKFNELPNTLPPGVWLTNLHISDKLLKSNKVQRSLIIAGTAYHQDPVREIGRITEFVSNLKENKAFARGFKEIKLDSMVSAELKNMPVKNFTISCKK